MAQIIPFQCKHCGERTDTYADVRLKFHQSHYTQSWGRTYIDEGRDVDHGMMSVFLCEKCAKSYVMQRKVMHGLIGLGVCAAALLLLLLARSIKPDYAFGRKLIAIAASACFVVQLYIEDQRLKELAEHMTRNRPDAVGLSRGFATSMAEMSLRSDFAQWVWMIGLGAALLSMLVTLFMPKAAWEGYTLGLLWIILIMAAVWLVWTVLHLFSAQAAARSEDTLREAVKYYFRYDDDINLWD